MSKIDKNVFAQTENQSEEYTLNFPVVGIGASAGGLEALQAFFKNMIDNPGAAFVIVQHLSPDYKSLMNELLARFTKMIIHQVTNGIQIEENHIYLIPPRKNMTIFKGKLFLTEQETSRTLNFPIDVFFKSLALDQEKNAIGIILSGTGSDGAFGIRAIKDNGGIAMVQDDRSAKFDGMPRSSISTGMVDFILPPEQLAEELVNYIKHPLVKQKEHIETQLFSNENQLLKLIALIREVEGIDFTEYKETTLVRRLEKRISLNRFITIDEYIRFCAENNKEITKLVNDFLIGVTRFFRDEEAFEKLIQEVIPKLLNDKPYDKKEVRIWVVGCSTGEEAYSLAILIKEFMLKNKISRDIKIFATDLDSHALEYAGTGIYPESILPDITQERLSKFFIRKENGYQVQDNIRSMIIFARHNILQDPPFSKINLISCRNLLIYLKTAAQQRILSLFYIALVENGFLFLGNSESLGNMAEGFEIIDNKNKIYKQQQGYKTTILHSYSNALYATRKLNKDNFLSFNKTLKPKYYFLDGIFNEILDKYLPPTVIIDESYNVVHTINNVSKFITIPTGQVNFNLLKMLPHEIAILAGNLLRRASKTNQEIVIENIPFHQLYDNSNIIIAIKAKKMVNSKNGDIFYLVTFIEKEHSEISESDTLSTDNLDFNKHYIEKIQELERELQFKSESLQAAIEELETSNEELQSSNEELIASNEELQSTNEELQSVNEELYTVNSEHIKKIEELSELNADFDNLLKNSGIGTVFLDNQLIIRKTNQIGAQLANILSTDIGRPADHLFFDKIYPDFLNNIKTVSKTLQIMEKEVLIENNYFLIRIIPYRTLENAVNGVIIIFIDITLLKNSEKKISKLSERLEMVMEIGGISWWEWNYRTNKVSTGIGKYQMLGYTPDEIGNTYQDWIKLIHPDDLPVAMEAMKKLLSGNSPIYETEYRIKSKDGTYLWYKDKGGILIRDVNYQPLIIAGVVMNVSHEKQLMIKYQKVQKDIKDIEIKYDQIFYTLNHGIVFQNNKGEIIEANPNAQKILGLTLEQMKGLTSIHPEWKAVHEDGSEFPGDEHPAMVALKTGKEIHDVKMGVFNPSIRQYRWIKVDAIPLFNANESEPYMVYAIFEDITDKIVK